MGLLARAFDFERRLSPENPNVSMYDAFRYYLEGFTSSSGEQVNQETAIRLTAVWRAVRLLAETTASLPLFVFEREEGRRGPIKAKDHPVTRLLHSQPNPNMTAFTFREFLKASVVLRGNAYAVIRRDRLRNPVELWPLIPQQVEPKVDEEGEIYYEIQLKNGGRESWEKENILHVPGLGFDGICGKSVLAVAREAIGLGLAAQKFGAKLFKDGRPSGVLTAPGPGKVLPNEKDQLSKSWIQMQKETGIPVLDRGLKFEKIGIDPEDAQFIETRKLQVTEVARIFGVPPHLLYDLERATFTNIEHQGLEFLTYTERPWCVRFEMEYDRKLLREDERARFYTGHVMAGLLRGDMAATGTFFGQMRQWGVFSANDCLELLDRPDIGPKGDIYLSPINMVPAEQAGQGFKTPSTGTPASNAGPGPGGVRQAAALGIRGLRLRRRIRAAQMPILEKMGLELIRFEIAEVRAGLKRTLLAEEKGSRPPEKRSTGAFLDWLGGYYSQRQGEIARKVLPTVRSYAEIIEVAACEEIGVEAGDQPSAATESAVRDYAAAFAQVEAEGRHANLRSQVLPGDREASAAAIESRLSQMEESYPASVADQLSVAVMNAIAGAVFETSGFDIAPDGCDIVPVVKGVQG